MLRLRDLPTGASSLLTERSTNSGPGIVCTFGSDQADFPSEIRLIVLRYPDGFSDAWQAIYSIYLIMSLSPSHDFRLR